jgi:hypothetical protein
MSRQRYRIQAVNDKLQRGGSAWHHAVRACRRRLNLGVFLHAAAGVVSIWTIAACLLTAALLFLLSRPELRPIALPLVLVGLLISWFRARKQFFSEKQTSAWLDAHGNLSGLGALKQDGVKLPTYLEERLSSVIPNQMGLRVRWVRVLGPLTLPIVSLVVLQLLPWVSDANATRSRPIVFDQIQKQQERLDELERENLLPDADLALMKKELEELNRSADSQPNDPMLLEASDRLAEQMARAELAALDDIRAAMEHATSLQQLTSAGKAMEQWQIAEAKARLPELLQKLKEMGLNPNSLAGLKNDELAEMMRSYLAGSQGEFPTDPESYAKMMQAMKEWAQMKEQQAGQCQLGSGCDSTGSYLTEKLGQGLVGMGKPGSGGVSRGRGDAELTFGEEVHLENKAFQPRMLPHGKSPSADHSFPLSVEMLDPMAQPKAEKNGSDQASDSSAKTEGRSAPVPLRYRKTVNQYFKTE